MRCVLILLMVTCLTLAGCASGSEKRTKLIPKGPIPVVRTYNSEVGGPAHQGLYVINSSRGLANAGLIRPDRIEVDFDTEMLILYAMGDKDRRGFWAMIESVFARDGVYVVNTRYNSPGGVPAQGRYRPFAVAVIPRSDITTARPVVRLTTGAPKPVSY
ncbi:hypothetical protein [Mucisphaera calidilacus]|uniref:Uncharacterized protein n=1 Tax=Mucisphaera calidilacus TaxID=2527982 RepID=A0A518BTI6_9BACT|nr:hypothetical protein [Mucisphaera calidilacus]QDU70275.1 hypothetical protein Pan265_00980 [Mucisphaera calidilacus]